jgi:hypothetical protein
MATHWLAADEGTLRRPAWMHDMTNRGEATAALCREARILEDAFGLSPYGRRRLQWETRGGARGVYELAESVQQSA